MSRTSLLSLHGRVSGVGLRVDATAVPTKPPPQALKLSALNPLAQSRIPETFAACPFVISEAEVGMG